MNDAHKTSLDAAIVGTTVSVGWIALAIVYAIWQFAHDGLHGWSAVGLLGFAVPGAFLVFYFGICTCAMIPEQERKKAMYLTVCIAAFLVDLALGCIGMVRMGGS